MRLVSGKVTFTTMTAQATLVRDGRVWATGAARRRGGREQLQLHARRLLTAGRYTLTLIYTDRHDHCHHTHQTITIT